MGSLMEHTSMAILQFRPGVYKVLTRLEDGQRKSQDLNHAGGKAATR